MKNWLFALLVAALGAGALAPSDVEARRLGGGGSAGMQRSTPPRATPDAVPAKPAAPTQAAPAAAAAPKRSWMGPIAGLAAGLGIAALMSHLGMGAAFGNFLMMALLAVAAVFVIRWVMRRMSGPRLATQGADGRIGDAPMAREPLWPAAAVPVAAAPLLTADPVGAAAPGAEMAVPPTQQAAGTLPSGFNAAGFERSAKMIFIRMQAANDSADLDDLREFTTPEMFASLRLDLQERGAAVQRTDVLKVDAELLDVTQEPGRQIASVRFHGLVREEREAAVNDFDEVWHLVKPDDGSRNWTIAGIQQRH